MSLFKQLFHTNVNDHTEKVQGLTYLSWAYAWSEIKKADEKATAKIHEFPMLDGNYHPIEGVTVPYLRTPEGYFVKVSVTINGHTETEMLPVMDNKNVPLGTVAPTWVKQANGKSTKDYAPTPLPTTFDINKSHKRCLVKAIALHGLGLYIYSGEDVPEVDEDAKKKAEEERVAIAKKIRDTQRQTRKTGKPEVADQLDTYIKGLETAAKLKIENMPLDFLQKAGNLVQIKLDELTLSKEEVKA